jgi:hypothetical protein
VVCASSFSRVRFSVYLVTDLDLQRCREEAEEWVARGFFCFGGCLALVIVMVGLAQTTTLEYFITFQVIIMSLATYQPPNVEIGHDFPAFPAQARTLFK